LHCVIVAPLVAATGLQFVVGWLPPPLPDPLHSLTVAGVTVDVPVILLTMLTVHSIVPPPPLADPLHWVTELVSAVDGVVDVMHVGAACAAP
jgi:hypothetical protein